MPDLAAPHGLLAPDDIDGQARAGWSLGERLCTQCNAYHQAWGVLRAAGVMNAAETDRTVLGPLLDERVEPNDHILIAGAADAGLLQLVVSTASARPITISVVDRCPSPIALINGIAWPPEVAVDARHVDLTAFEDVDRYKLVLSHSMLPFADPPTRLAILRRLRTSLQADGTLLLVVRTSPVLGTELSDDHDQAWLDRAWPKLSSVPALVDYCGDSLPLKLAEVARSRRGRTYGFRDPAEVVALLVEAGFEVERHIRGKVSSTLEVRGRVVERQSQVFVARPR